MDNLQENEAVKELLKLLMENRPEMGKEYSTMLRQMDGMEKQLDAALAELQEVKAQLAEMQESPAKQTVSRVAGLVEGKLHAVQERLTGIKDRIVVGAKEAVEGFKHMGVAALDKAVSGLGIKRALEGMQNELDSSILNMNKSIERIESIGNELRSVGGHVKNIARAVAGKERQAVDGGRVGRFQAAVLAPMRMEKTMLYRLRNKVLAAIGGVERLEQTAGRGKETEKSKGQEAGASRSSGERQAGKGEEKPSVLNDLQQKKKEAAAHFAPDRDRKPQEAAL